MCDASGAVPSVSVAGAARPLVMVVDGVEDERDMQRGLTKSGETSPRGLHMRAALNVSDVLEECKARVFAARGGEGAGNRTSPEKEAAAEDAIEAGDLPKTRLPRALVREHERQGVLRTILDEAIAELHIRHRMPIKDIAEHLGYSYIHVYQRWRETVKRAQKQDLLLSEADKMTMREFVFGHLEDVIAISMPRIKEHAAYGMVVVNAVAKIADLGGLDVEEGGGRKELAELAEKVKGVSPLLAAKLRRNEKNPAGGVASIKKAMDKELGGKG